MVNSRPSDSLSAALASSDRSRLISTVLAASAISPAPASPSRLRSAPKNRSLDSSLLSVIAIAVAVPVAWPSTLESNSEPVSSALPMPLPVHS